jgi:hypothetical protein
MAIKTEEMAFTSGSLKSPKTEEMLLKFRKLRDQAKKDADKAKEEAAKAESERKKAKLAKLAIEGDPLFPLVKKLENETKKLENEVEQLSVRLANVEGKQQ